MLRNVKVQDEIKKLKQGRLNRELLTEEVSFGSTTNSVELLDKQKALQWLADHMDFATVKQKAEIALLQAKVNEQSGDGTQEKTEAIDNIRELLDQVQPMNSDEAAE